ARGEYSIDQPERLRKTLLPQGDLPVRDSVDSGRDAVSQRAQLTGAEDELAHARAAATEDEVVRAQLRQLELRLLDQEQVLDWLRERAEPVLGRRLQLAQLVLRLREREPAMEVDLQRLRADVVGRHVRVDTCVDPDRARDDAALPAQLRDRFGEQLDVELEAESGDVTGLLVAEQVPGAADLEVAHRDREPRAELGVVGERRKPPAGF